ncbi:hypothetical protein GCM10010170_069310 [Dactylosporangium salmoneum]|uniref:Uncharacterized protein n=1 Tax=Dactylosporangium salmoneum TaxID=53361 RepID=A0ABN3H4N9_9ACTN
MRVLVGGSAQISMHYAHRPLAGRLPGRYGARPVVDRVALTRFLMPQAILAAYSVHGGRVA